MSYVIAMEEISKVDASVSVCMSVNNSLVCWGLETFGTEEQKQKYLVPLAQGIKDNELYIGAFLLSEPEAGSDAIIATHYCKRQWRPLSSQRHKELDHQWKYGISLPRNGANRRIERQQRHQCVYR